MLNKVDWQKLATCKDEQTCRANWSDYYYDHDLDSTHWLLVQGYTLLFLAYTSFTVWSFWQSLQQAWNCQFIVHEKLGISRRKLQGGAVSWDEVVQKLVTAQDSGEYRTTLSRLDPLLIAQRIMRKENFLIAFWNQKLLDVQIGKRHYWCPTLEWSIHVSILNHLFNHKYEIRPAFLLDATALQRRFIVCGVLHLLLLPFLMLFVTFHFLLRNVYFFKTQKQYMGNKQWSTVAQWTFREFNELPHVLERRLEPSYEASENYLKLFGQSEYMAALGKLLTFVGGAVGGVLVVLGVLNDAILLHVQLWGRNLLWYAGIAAGVYSIGRSLVPTKEAQPSVTRNLFADMDAALQSVSQHTHYYPEHWKGRGWDQNVHSQFGLFFDSKVKLFLWELISLILAPYILIVKLSANAPAICEFCATIKAKAPGAGEVCGYSTFDFDKFKDEAWDGRTLGHSVLVDDAGIHESLLESIVRTGNLEEATRNHPKPRARDGKMEKSFFGFKAAHPSWKCNPSGQSLVDRVEEYRQAELASISRERDLYIEAAARQLETLVKLEDQGNKSSLTTTWNSKPDQHGPYSQQLGGPADADAGSHPSPRLNPAQSPAAAAFDENSDGHPRSINGDSGIQKSDLGGRESKYCAKL
jgi:autophagy-related protein 9